MAEETRSVQDGAGLGAPTAPHATDSEAGHKRRTGPEKFWDRRRAGRVLALSLLGSLAIHYAAGPWSLLPEEHLDIHDVEGDLSIPVDLIEDQPPEPPAPAPPEPASTSQEPGAAATPKPKSHGPEDAGAHDAGEEDAGDGGEEDAGHHDAGVPDASALAMTDAGLSDAAVASAERGDGGGPGDKSHDPSALVAAASDVQAGPPLVRLFVNMEEIRKNPAGASIGPLLTAIPQWDEFMSGTNVDPVRDTDWVYITGPALLHTERDVILVHYSASDKVVDHAIDVVSKKYTSGGPFDVGVPGVKASLGHADRAQRVFLRPQTRVLAVVPPDYAKTAAKTLVKARVSAHVRPGEALRLTLQTPHRPMPFIPESISEMRLWITPRADGGGDVYGEGDTPDAASASSAADALRKVVRQQNSIAVRIITQGLLNSVDITAQGAQVRLHAPVTQDQVNAVLNLVAGQLGVTLPSDATRSAPGAPSGSQGRP